MDALAPQSRSKTRFLLATCLVGLLAIQLLNTLSIAQEIGKRPYGPEQVTGPPDTPVAGDFETAWASLTPDGQPEWLLLEYSEFVVPAVVRIVETFNPGAVVRVTLIDELDREVEVWGGEDPISSTQDRGTSEIPVFTKLRTNRFKVYLDSESVAGWNQIDAVAVVSEAGSTQWAVRAEASSTYGVNPIVSGRLLDGKGQPAEGVTVAQYWDFGYRFATARGGVETGPAGGFAIPARFDSSRIAFLAVDTGGRIGARIDVDLQNVGIEHEATLVALVEVRGKFFSMESGELPSWTRVSVSTAEGSTIGIHGELTTDRKFSVFLPPGRYQLRGSGENRVDWVKELDVTSGASVIDLGSIALEPNLLAQYRGKVLPASIWNVTDARGLDRTITPADLRGKWVLLEFWGYW